MIKRKLGNSGIEVSELAFGCVSLGMPYGIGVAGADDMLPEEDAVKLLKTAVDRGINFYDTARNYGISETILGKAFKGIRDKVVICTKAGHFKSNDDEAICSEMNSSLKESLKQLQTDYIDVFMSHNGTLELFKNDRLVGEYVKIKESGIARAIGVSVYTVEESIAAVNSGVWDLVQLPFNLMDQRHGVVFDAALKKGVGIVVRSVLFKGVLTDKGDNLHPALNAVSQHRQKYNCLLNDKVPTLSKLATKFVLSQRGVSSVLVGIDKMEYLEDALDVIDGNYLDEAVLAKAKELAYPEPEFLDLPKWDRLGWLK